ncbi:alpha/beta hydrolase family protein [Plantactinospora sonchi]|uniref:Alpha/beta hydrolase n=1 Tax=Plantactinospora sonchi TaxID=1544735 RepID=A0ABU7RPV1_9ACTN
MPEILSLVDVDRAHWTDPGAPRPIRTTLWRPDRTDAAPLVLFSHGTGGSAEEFGWLAEELTGAGYAVAGVDHHGNTASEPYVALGFTFVWERPRDFTIVLDALADDPGIDLTRVGAAGFSLGGYTVAALVGARISPRRYRLLLDEPDQTNLPEYPNLIQEIRQRDPALAYALSMSACDVDVADRRVRCAFQLAPVLGMVCDPASLSRISVPVGGLWGAADEQAPGALGALVFQEHIPGATARCLPETAHYDFAVRAETRAEVIREALAFFGRTLPA